LSCYRREVGAIVLVVALRPKSDRDALEGIDVLADGREVLRARVRAVPHEGAANAALIALLARVAGRPKSAVAITAGLRGRVKQVRVKGDPAELAAIVDRWKAI